MISLCLWYQPVICICLLNIPPWVATGVSLLQRCNPLPAGASDGNNRLYGGGRGRRRTGGEKRSTEKAVTPKPQMPAVGESCILHQTPITGSWLCWDLEAACNTHYSAKTCSIISVVPKPESPQATLFTKRNNCHYIMVWRQTKCSSMLILKSRFQDLIKYTQDTMDHIFFKYIIKVLFLEFSCRKGKCVNIHHVMTSIHNADHAFTVKVLHKCCFLAGESREARSCWLHLNICKHFPHATWTELVWPCEVTYRR